MLSWQAIGVSMVLFIGIGALLLWVSVPHIFRSVLELSGRRRTTRSRASSWLYLIYGSLLCLAALFEIVTYLAWLARAIAGS